MREQYAKVTAEQTEFVLRESEEEQRSVRDSAFQRQQEAAFLRMMKERDDREAFAKHKAFEREKLRRTFPITR